MDKDLKIEFGELYRLNPNSEYWIVNAQRMMKFTDSNPIVVKLEHSFRDKLFFGHLQDGGYDTEIEFGIDDIVEKFDEEKYRKEQESERINLITLFTYDLHLPIQNSDGSLQDLEDR